MEDLSFKKIEQSIKDRKRLHLSFLENVKTYKPFLELEEKAFSDGALDRKTKELMLTGRAIDAQEALQNGLINKVVANDKLEEEVDKLAEMIACHPYDAIVTGKANFEVAQDIAGIGAGAVAGHELGVWQSNIQFRPGEYNLIKSLSEKGVKGAVRERDDVYRDTPLTGK